ELGRLHRGRGERAGAGPGDGARRPGRSGVVPRFRFRGIPDGTDPGRRRRSGVHMTDQVWIVVLIVVVYMAVLAGISVAARRSSRTSEGFASGGRVFPAVLIGFLLMS